MGFCLAHTTHHASPQQVSHVGEVLSQSSIGFLGVARVQSVHLFKSDLLPGGAAYTKMFSAPFGEPEN